MAIKAVPFILSALTLVDASLLRRSRGATRLEFGRVVASKEESQRLLHEQAKFRMLTMSFDDAMSLDFTMSMPLDDAMSMSFDFAMSIPFDDFMSMPFDNSMSMPLDDIMSMHQDTMTIPVNTEPTNPSLEGTLVCDDSLPSITVPIDFEVENPDLDDIESFLTAILSTAIEADFALSSDSLQKLSDTKERKLEESTVRGVKILNVTEVDGTTCDSENSDCHVVHVENTVLHSKGTSSNAARAEFLEKLFARLAGVNGVRVRAAASSLSSGLPTKVNDGTDKDLTTKGLSAAQIAMIVVFSVAAASIALVVVQRKFAIKNRGDDKSVASEETIPTNTKFYPAFTDLS